MDPWNSRFVRFIASFCYNLSLPFFFPSCLLSFPLLYLLLFIYYLTPLLLILRLFHPFSGNVSFVQAPAAEGSTRKVDPVCVISWPHQGLIPSSKWVFYVKCSRNFALRPRPRPPRWYGGALFFTSPFLKVSFLLQTLPAPRLTTTTITILLWAPFFRPYKSEKLVHKTRLSWLVGGLSNRVNLYLASQCW